MRPRFRERYRVRSYETDPLGRLQVPTLCRLLQEAATAHAAELGVSVDALIGRGVAWVLSRLDLDVSLWPRGEDEIEIETWPSAIAARPWCREASFSVTTTRPRSATSC